VDVEDLCGTGRQLFLHVARLCRRRQECLDALFAQHPVQPPVQLLTDDRHRTRPLFWRLPGTQQRDELLMELEQLRALIKTLKPE
jgi:hypothetical protein